MAEQKRCMWCMNSKGKTDLNFSVIDDDYVQYVHLNLIKFCPFCGRKLRADNG